MASSELQPILAVLRARREERAALSVVQARESYDKQARLFRLGDDAQVEAVPELVPGGVPGEWLWTRPEARQGTAPVILYLHGGAYVMGSLRSHRDLASRIARAAGGQAFHLDYRLAPEHPFPAAVDDAVAAYRGLLALGVEPRRLALAGDSAGGGLALALLTRLREEGEPMPAAAALLSPWTDLEGSGRTMAELAKADPTIDLATLLHAAGLYLAGADPRTPTAAPLWADPAGWPPLLFQVGGAETLLDDSRRVAQRAEAAGVDVALEIWPEMFHGWQLFARLLPEGRQAIEEVGAFLRRHGGGGADPRPQPGGGGPGP